MLLVDVVEPDDDYTAEPLALGRRARARGRAGDGDGRVDLQELEFAALLHDVGKIAIPKQILHKPAALTDERVRGDEDAHDRGPVPARPGRRPARPRRRDRALVPRALGRQGLPRRPRGEEIPLAARIVFVCDAYNAMTTDRPYRAALRIEQAIQELLSNAGTQFDPAS